jgi:ferredoxin
MIPRRNNVIALVLLIVCVVATSTLGFTPSSSSTLFTASSPSRTTNGCSKKASLLTRYVVQGNSKKKGYEPKWTKKKTLADEQGSTSSLGFENVGLKGTIPVVFKQGNDTRTSMAWAGQPLRDVATQAGQYIKYGCGKGECGTCECMMNGKWIRPCIETVPSSAASDGDLIIQVKAVKAKSASSGKFFSLRSFIMGFWNNLLGMIGFVKFRKAARKNWEERKAYEDLVRQKTMEKKLARAKAAVAANKKGGQDPSPGLA